MSARTAIFIDNCAWEFDGSNQHLEESGLTAFQLTVASAHEDAETTMAEMRRVQGVIDAQPQKLRLIRTTADLREAKDQGQVGIVFHFQNAGPIGDDLSLVDAFHAMGLRTVQITYNETNLVGSGCLVAEDLGLTAFGRRLIGKLNDSGILVDLSHVGERTSLEAIEASAQPCTFSHSNPKGLADNPRNISDEQIRACAARGGVIGACGWGPISWTRGPQPPDIGTMADHMSYIADLVGPQHVGIATDAPISGAMDRILAHFAEINAAYGEVTGDFVATFGNDLKHRFPLPIRSLPKLAETLERRGWGRSEIDGAMGGNMLSLYERVWR